MMRGERQEKRRAREGIRKSRIKSGARESCGKIKREEEEDKPGRRRGEKTEATLMMHCQPSSR
jgi:hypothetical protein